MFSLVFTDNMVLVVVVVVDIVVAVSVVQVVVVVIVDNVVMGIDVSASWVLFKIQVAVCTKQVVGSCLC